eukprot:217556-Rhodomonas_salina.2
MILFLIPGYRVRSSEFTASGSFIQGSILPRPPLPHSFLVAVNGSLSTVVPVKMLLMTDTDSDERSSKVSRNTLVVVAGYYSGKTPLPRQWRIIWYPGTTTSTSIVDFMRPTFSRTALRVAQTFETRTNFRRIRRSIPFCTVRSQYKSRFKRLRNAAAQRHAREAPVVTGSRCNEIHKTSRSSTGSSSSSIRGFIRRSAN